MTCSFWIHWYGPAGHVQAQATSQSDQKGVQWMDLCFSNIRQWSNITWKGRKSKRIRRGMILTRTIWTRLSTIAIVIRKNSSNNYSTSTNSKKTTITVIATVYIHIYKSYIYIYIHTYIHTNIHWIWSFGGILTVYFIKQKKNAAKLPTAGWLTGFPWLLLLHHQVFLESREISSKYPRVNLHRCGTYWNTLANVDG